MHLALPRSHEELGVTREASTHIFTTTLATRPQCEATSCTDAAIQDDWKGIREVGEHLALKRCEDLVRKFHLVRFDVFFFFEKFLGSNDAFGLIINRTFSSRTW